MLLRGSEAEVKMTLRLLRRYAKIEVVAYHIERGVHPWWCQVFKELAKPGMENSAAW